MTMPATLQTALRERRALKVISGLTNFDLDRVVTIARAAQRGGATWIDIAVDPALVRAVHQHCNLPLCVSAIEPEKFVAAVEAGADVVEIGNFDAFYAQGRRFEAEEVLALTHQTRSLLPHTPLSVTVPHLLPLDQQATLAEALVAAGADFIQTEGGTSSQPSHAGTLGLMEKAVPTLAAASEISKVVTVPVICSSGLSSVTVPLAIAAGASGVGVGSAINRLSTELEMIATIQGLVQALGRTAVIPV